jgi:hypothetical protein
MEDQILASLTRRDLLKKVSSLPFAVSAGLESMLQGCAGQIVNPGVFDNKGPNPNYKGINSTFAETASVIGTPGVEYSCNRSTPMVASARGFLGRWYSVGGSGARGSGEVVELLHQEPDKMGRDYPYFATRYGHISVDEQIKKAKPGDVIPRGTIVGYQYYYNTAKFMAIEAFDPNHAYFVDPENYSPGYSHLKYWDGQTNLEVDNYGEKFNKQVETLENLIKKYKPKDLTHWLKIPAWKQKHKNLHPSILTKWRAIENLYQKEPEKFSASKEEVEQLKKEFYANQPIILTLPFKTP